MRIFHLSLLIALTACTFQACQKESATDTTNTPEIATETCPSLSAEIAHLNEGGEDPKNALLLTYFTAAQLAELHANTCLTKDLALETNLSGEEAEDRAAGLKNRFWTPGREIRVRFLNGSAALQNKAFGYAQEWEDYANIHFKKVASGASEIRVLFSADGHWSYIGTDNLTIDACEKTMNLELADNTAATEIRRVTLHEFGHVLGMRHEHQQPAANIPWNTSAVYAYYAQQDWTKQDVDEQVLNKNSAESTQYTAFDAQSIMEYPVSASLTTNCYSIPWNTQLSTADKGFIGMMYSSQRIRVHHAASGYNTSITFLLDGIYHTLQPGETLQAPAYTSGNQLAIREQPSGAWVWDSGYTPTYGKNYKIVRVGSTNNLTLAVE
ncbi:MAG: M12 family metallopeptidase [Saprospiraceae bacterium]